jgi:hypothetical protein
MKMLLAFCLAAVMGGSAAASCEAPPFSTGQVWEESKSTVLAAISIRIADFAPQRLVCLAEALKQKYSGRERIDILIFSSREAARRYSPGQADYAKPIKRHGNAYDPHWFFARQLHASYSYNAAKREEYIDLKPLGSDGQGPYDTRIKLPVSAAPRCRYEMSGRCLLALEDIVYPTDALKDKVSGTITLAGTIAREGNMTGVRLAEPNALPTERAELLTKAALQNLTTWRFEEAPKSDAFRITFSYAIDPSVLHRGEVDVNVALPNQVTIRGNPPE